MKKKGLWIGLGVVAAVVLLIAVSFIGTYNGLVDLGEEVDLKYANIATVLQRRMDLIPNLVNTVKGYAKHEQDVIDSVTNARAKLAGANTLEEKAEADAELSGALNKLLVVVENYPDLKANTTFINLQDELAGTENRIAVARKDYNEVVKNYNKQIKKFPKNIIAGMLNMEQKEYFEAKDAANEAPNVSFE